VEATVPPVVRETVQAVVAANVPEGVPLAALAKTLGIDKSAASRRWASARARGYLKNLERAWRGRVSERLVDANEVARLLRVPERWVREQTRFGRIPNVRLGRYRRYRLGAILAWVEAGGGRSGETGATPEQRGSRVSQYKRPVQTRRGPLC
jgi:excisionase family DNA binding protein